jgi:hypothetical protein
MTQRITKNRFPNPEITIKGLRGLRGLFRATCHLCGDEKDGCIAAYMRNGTEFTLIDHPLCSDCRAKMRNKYRVHENHK